MPLPEHQQTQRWTLLFRGQGFTVYPTASAALKLSQEQADDAFYSRRKLSSSLLLGGADDAEAWRILYALDNSADRCLPLYLILETRPPGGAWAQQWRGTFTCNECKFYVSRCQVEVTPVTDDGYREVLENWEKEHNVLAYATDQNRRAVTAQLKTLSTAGVEFLRIDTSQEADYVGTDGWTVFLRNKSFITGTGTAGNTNDKTVILFRYRQRAVPMIAVPGTTDYTAVDKSGAGWQVVDSGYVLNGVQVIDYVKAPEISGFPRGGYLIGTYQDWFGRKYGDQLLLLDCGAANPDPDKYIEVTGPDGYGANTDEHPGTCLNVRRETRRANFKTLWWKFGEFRFTRGFPLRDALYGLLQATVTGTTAADIVPPTAADLSDFLSNPINPATGATGYANEIPGLLISAASDVKRYGASEPATKVLLSLKTLLEDLASLYDVGWCIDPVTGWFRLEHRAWRETGPAASVLDLTREPSAILPAIYSYQTEKLPRTEELTISSALTEDPQTGRNWAKGEITYTGQCVNTREGQNKQSRSTARLTGDVAGMVLSGDALPDSALVLLAAAPDGTLEDGNRKVAATELLKRYHRFGRVRPSGTVAGQLVPFQSVKPGKLQEGVSAVLCSLNAFTPGLRVTTNLGSNGQVQKAEWELRSGVVTLSLALPSPDSDTPGPVAPRRAFNDAFNPSFG